MRTLTHSYGPRIKCVIARKKIVRARFFDVRQCEYLISSLHCSIHQPIPCDSVNVCTRSEGETNCDDFLTYLSIDLHVHNPYNTNKCLNKSKSAVTEIFRRHVGLSHLASRAVSGLKTEIVSG